MVSPVLSLAKDCRTMNGTTKHENIIFFRVDWSTRSRPRSEQVLRPTVVKHKQQEIHFQSNGIR